MSQSTENIVLNIAQAHSSHERPVFLSAPEYQAMGPDRPDPSEALFSMYLDRAIEDDKKMVERWKSTTDGILVFTGLFCAVVAVLLGLSVPNIQRNPQDTSSFYLAHIYQQLAAQSNGSEPPIPLGLTNPIEPFIPPTSAVWATGLWFLSLVISLTCALAALLLQQWARRYLQVAYEHPTPHKRARIRAFYKYGVNDLRVPLNIEVVPVMLHMSLFLFFVGLSVYLFGVHRTIFKVVTAWIGVCIVLYAYLTVLPVIHKNNPCSSPLSSSFSFCLTGIRYIFRPFDDFSYSMSKTAESFALNMDPRIDYYSLLWTFRSLEEDSDLEKFFEGLPRLCESSTGENLNMKRGFIEPNKSMLSDALFGMMDRTLSSNLVEEFVKNRRMTIFIKVLESESTSLLDPWLILRRVLFEDWHVLLDCIEYGLFVHNRMITPNTDDDSISRFYPQCVAALTISTVQNRDKRWIQLATVNTQHLSRPLHHNEDHPSILLANAIYVIRMSFRTYSRSEDDDRNDILDVSRKTIRAVCKFEIRHTLPELQHEFCDLWNKLVRTAQTDRIFYHRAVSVKMLRNIRKLYIALHGTLGTDFDTTAEWEQVLDNPGFYHECTENDHRSSSSFPNLQFNDRRNQADMPSPGDMPQLYSPTPFIPSNPAPSPARSRFPDAHPYVPPPADNSSYPHASSVPREQNVQ